VSVNKGTAYGKWVYDARLDGVRSFAGTTRRQSMRNSRPSRDPGSRHVLRLLVSIVALALAVLTIIQRHHLV
jgi:hypothetical protein